MDRWRRHLHGHRRRAPPAPRARRDGLRSGARRDDRGRTRVGSRRHRRRARTARGAGRRLRAGRLRRVPAGRPVSEHAAGDGDSRRRVRPVAAAAAARGDRCGRRPARPGRQASPGRRRRAGDRPPAATRGHRALLAARAAAGSAPPGAAPRELPVGRPARGRGKGPRGGRHRVGAGRLQERRPDPRARAADGRRRHRDRQGAGDRRGDVERARRLRLRPQRRRRLGHLRAVRPARGGQLRRPGRAGRGRPRADPLGPEGLSAGDGRCEPSARGRQPQREQARAGARAPLPAPQSASAAGRRAAPRARAARPGADRHRPARPRAVRRGPAGPGAGARRARRARGAGELQAAAGRAALEPKACRSVWRGERRREAFEREQSLLAQRRVRLGLALARPLDRARRLFR